MWYAWWWLHTLTLFTPSESQFQMGFWKRVVNVVRRVVPGGRTHRSTPPAAPRGQPSVTPADSPAWGTGFGSDSEGFALSNDGYDFAWYVAGYKAIHGEREDLETEPGRILTDGELARADYVVIKFSGAAGYKTFTSGPWEDWEDLWNHIADFYDVYDE